MRSSLPVSAAFVGALALAGCGGAPVKPTPSPITYASTAQEATAVLASASGSLVSGKLMLAPMGDGVHIHGEIGGLQPNGRFGFHVHENGDCSTVDASSAGGHFNPTGSPHGRAGAGEAHHAGDMDNITSDTEGVAQVNVHPLNVTLGGHAPNDIANRAIIVHADPDDYASQPAGNAGARVACGIIRITR
jgi:Cu-Zn family superoxide dismutase